MSAQSMSGSSPTIHRTTTGTTSDTITASGVGRSRVMVRNRSSLAVPLDLWARGGATAVAAQDGMIYIGPGESAVISVGADGSGNTIISVIGNATPYSVSF